MKETPYDNEIKKLEDDLEETYTLLEDAKQKRALFLCPFKVGGDVIDKKKRNGRVVRIYSSYGGFQFNVSLHRKDESLGKITKAYDWDKWELIEE